MKTHMKSSGSKNVQSIPTIPNSSVFFFPFIMQYLTFVVKAVFYLQTSFDHVSV